MPRVQKTTEARYCIHCGELLVRKRYPSGLETFTRFVERKACGQSCANRRHDVTVPGLRSRAKRLRGDQCESCGASTGLHAHHRDGDITNNVVANIATLCASCHLKHHWVVDRDKRVASARNRKPRPASTSSELGSLPASSPSRPQL